MGLTLFWSLTLVANRCNCSLSHFRVGFKRERERKIAGIDPSSFILFLLKKEQVAF